MNFFIDNLIIPITEDPAIFVTAGIIIYILAKIFSRFTNCTIIAGLPDFIILCILDLVIIVYIFLKSYNESYDIDTIFSFIFFPLLAITVFFSIKSNWGFFFPLYLIFSLVTKTILLILIPVSFMLMVGALSSGVSDKRYKDGTKNNQQTENLSRIFDLAAFLVLSFIKEKK